MPATPLKKEGNLCVAVQAIVQFKQLCSSSSSSTSAKPSILFQHPVRQVYDKALNHAAFAVPSLRVLSYSTLSGSLSLLLKRGMTERLRSNSSDTKSLESERTGELLHPSEVNSINSSSFAIPQFKQILQFKHFRKAWHPRPTPRPAGIR